MREITTRMVPGAERPPTPSGSWRQFYCPQCERSLWMQEPLTPKSCVACGGKLTLREKAVEPPDGSL